MENSAPRGEEMSLEFCLTPGNPKHEAPVLPDLVGGLLLHLPTSRQNTAVS